MHLNHDALKHRVTHSMFTTSVPDTFLHLIAVEYNMQFITIAANLGQNIIVLNLTLVIKILSGILFLYHNVEQFSAANG